MNILKGQRHVVFGVASNRSIAWAIATTLQDWGADVVLSCHPDLYDRVKKLADERHMLPPLPCDVVATDGEHTLELLFKTLEHGGAINGIVHAIAYSKSEELAGRYLDTTRENFALTMAVSCFSLTEIMRRALPLMPYGGGIATLSFDASHRTYPHYNVMGLAKAALEASVRYLAVDAGEHNVRVNSLSASPEDTLSARGIKNFRAIGRFAEAKSPLGRRASLQEIANMVAFLQSPMGTGITGQNIMVDCGASITEMPPPRNAALMAEAMTTVAQLHAKNAETKS